MPNSVPTIQPMRTHTLRIALSKLPRENASNIISMKRPHSILIPSMGDKMCGYCLILTRRSMGQSQFQHAMEELNSTTYIYIYNGLLPPQNTTSQSCGTQCLWLYAWQNKNPKTQRSMLLFQCPISISAVSNITHDRQNLPDLNAGLAAASIALTGRYTNPNGSKEKIWQQYRVYPSG